MMDVVQSLPKAEDICLPFEMVEDELPERFLKKAKEELNETPEVPRKCLEVLKEMLHAQYKDAKFISDNEFLLPFLRSKKFDVERSFHLIQNFVKLKSKLTYLHTISSFNAIKDIWKTNVNGILPYRDPCGRVIIFFRAERWNPSEITLEEMYASTVSLIIYALHHPLTQINGIVAIMDLKGMTLAQLRTFTPSYARLLTYCIQDCLPGRYKALHVINESTFFKYAYALVKIFLRQKFRNRLFVHGTDMTSFHKYIPPSVLPSEFGGSLESFDSYNYLLSQPESKNDRVWKILNYCEAPDV